ncbi:hypothetical protein IscW_ISCW009708, partial [Ixodes scapularis]
EGQDSTRLQPGWGEEKEVSVVENNREVEARSAGEEDDEVNPARKNRKVETR